MSHYNQPVFISVLFIVCALCQVQAQRQDQKTKGLSKGWWWPPVYNTFSPVEDTTEWSWTTTAWDTADWETTDWADTNTEFPTTRTTTRTPGVNPTQGPPTTEACGVTVPKKKIVGGTKVPSTGIFPWQAALLHNSRKFCGAVLVSKDWVVSAAHCMLYPADSLEVILGDLRTSTYDYGEVKKRVSYYTSHSDYSSSNYQNDIAVIKLSSPVSYTDTIRPICLPCNHRYVDFTGVSITIAGWGHDEENGQMTDDLMEVSVPIISNRDCAAKYTSYIRTTSLCAGEPQGGKDSCQGDSGGPAVWGDTGVSYLLGVVSFGNGCAREGWPGVYARVTEYIQWIEQNTGVDFCK